MSISVLVGELATIPASISGEVNTLTATTSDACDILGMLGSLLGDGFGVVEKAIQAILKSIAEFAAPFLAVINQVIGLIQGLADIFLSLVEGIVNEIRGVLALISSIVRSVVGLVSGIAARLGDLVRSLKAAACQGILNIATSLGGGTPSLSSLGDAALAAGGNLIETSAATAATAAAAEATGVATNLSSNLTGGLSSATSSITGKVADLQSAISFG